MTKLVAVEYENKITVHLPGAECAFSFYTLCGDDGDEAESTCQNVPGDAKVDCLACYRIWKVARRYTKKDFDIEE